MSFVTSTVNITVFGYIYENFFYIYIYIFKIV